MKIKANAAAQLLSELGWPIAKTKWTEKQMLAAKLERAIKDRGDELPEVESEECKALLEKVKESIAAGNSIKVIYSGGAAEKEKPEEKEKPVKKKGKKEEAPATEEAKPVKKKGKKEEAKEEEDTAPRLKPKKKVAPTDGKKPGVVAFIIKTLSKAKPDKGLTHEEVLEKCVEEFPDREVEGMKKTILNQISYFIKKQHKLDLRRTEERPAGYWIESK